MSVTALCVQQKWWSLSLQCCCCFGSEAYPLGLTEVDTEMLIFQWLCGGIQTSDALSLCISQCGQLQHWFNKAFTDATITMSSLVKADLKTDFTWHHGATFQLLLCWCSKQAFAVAVSSVLLSSAIDLTDPVN